MHDDSSDVQKQRVRARLSAGEDYYTQFKGDRKRLNDRDLVEAVVCLANGRGGMLVIGAEDDGTLTGAQPRHEGGRTHCVCKRWLPTTHSHQ
jgi:ATP-dependent DNA helicase RecG